jgi:hypothetical protein
MTQYRLVMKITPDPATWETHTIERDSLEVGEELTVEGYPGRWLIVGAHIPADSTEPEENAFDCEPVDGEPLPPPIRGGSTDRDSMNLRATKHPRRP